MFTHLTWKKKNLKLAAINIGTVWHNKDPYLEDERGFEQ